jgi:hypothetical protein
LGEARKDGSKFASATKRRWELSAYLDVSGVVAEINKPIREGKLGKLNNAA